MTEDVRPADRSSAIHHMQILAGLVLDYAPTVDRDRRFGELMETIAAWREARTRVLGDRDWTDDNPAGRLGASALLRELVDGMHRAEADHPAVARELVPDGRSPNSAWSLAKWAVTDQRQWQDDATSRPVLSEEVRAQRRAERESWAMNSGAAAPIMPPSGRPASGRQP